LEQNLRTGALCWWDERLGSSTLDALILRKEQPRAVRPWRGPQPQPRSQV